MKALTFTLIAEPPERLDLSPLTPARLAGLDKRAMLADQARPEQARLDRRRYFPGGRRRSRRHRLRRGRRPRFDGVGAGLTDGQIR